MAGLDTTRLWALFVLRAKLTYRLFGREKGRILFAILMFLTIGSVVVGLSIASFVAYRELPDHWPSAVLGIVLVVLWLIWLVFPVVANQLNEGADITRLLIYPIRQRELLINIFTGTIFDYPTYLMLPMLIAALLAWGLNLTFPLVLLGLVVCYLHMVVIGQLVNTGLGGIINSRRFRDVFLIVMTLFGSTCYFWQLGIQNFAETYVTADDFRTLIDWQPLEILRWFPTGAVAQSIALANEGAWGMALLWLGYSLVWLAGLTAVWWQLLTRLTTGGGFIFNLDQRQQEKEAKQSKRPARNLNLSWLPDPIAEVMMKEFRVSWRLPLRRAGLIQSIIFPLLMVGLFLFGDIGSLNEDMSSFGLGLPFFALFGYWTVSNNLLAWEGYGIGNLLLFPVPRQQILVGKGLALFVMGSVPFLLLGIILTIVLGGWQTIVGLLTGLGAGLIVIGVCAVAAVVAPIRLNVDGKGFQNNVGKGGGGCLAVFLMMLVVPAAIGLLSVPLALPIFLTLFLDMPWIAFVGLLITLPYAVVIWWVTLKIAGDLMLQREAQIYQTLKQPEVAE